MRMKFTVEQVSIGNDGHHRVRLVPTQPLGGSESLAATDPISVEHKATWKATPTGVLKLTNLTDDAVSLFVEREEVLVEITAIKAR